MDTSVETLEALGGVAFRRRRSVWRLADREVRRRGCEVDGDTWIGREVVTGEREGRVE